MVSFPTTVFFSLILEKVGPVSNVINVVLLFLLMKINDAYLQKKILENMFFFIKIANNLFNGWTIFNFKQLDGKYFI